MISKVPHPELEKNQQQSISNVEKNDMQKSSFKQEDIAGLLSGQRSSLDWLKNKISPDSIGVYDINVTKNTFSRIYRVEDALLDYPVYTTAVNALRTIASEIVHPQDCEQLYRVLGAATLNGGEKLNPSNETIVYRHKGKDGKYYPVSIHIERSENLPERHVVLVLFDARKAQSVSEHRLTRLKKQFNIALEKMHGYLCDVDIQEGTYHLEGNAGLNDMPRDGKYDVVTKWMIDSSVHPNDREKMLSNLLLDNMVKALQSGKPEVSVDYRQKNAEGDYVWRNSQAVLMTDEGQENHDSVLIVAHDIKPKKEDKAEIKSQNEQPCSSIRGPHIDIPKDDSRSLIDKGLIGIFEWNCSLADKTLRKNIFTAPQLVADFGLPDNKTDFLMFLLVNDKIHPDDEDEFQSFMNTSDFSEGTRKIVCRITKDGHTFLWHRLSLTAVAQENGQDERIVGTVVNVEQELHAQQGLQKCAERDPLTGLYNPESFYLKGDQILNNNPSGTHIVVTMDIDRFKVVNDLYGIEGGNNALVTVAKLLQKHVGSTGICTRLYADVFSFMVESRNDEATVKLLMELMDAFTHTEYKSMLVPKFGIYRVPGKDTLISVAAERAGFAHKFVKKNPLKRWAFYDNTLRKKYVEEKQIESEMETALRESQFIINLQPKYDVQDEKVVGAEALVRWVHPLRGLMRPDFFIPLFERNGFILKLDAYVWEQVCKLIDKWRSEGRPLVPVSVNVSRLHLDSPNFKTSLLNLFSKYNIPLHLIELELTESMFVENEKVLSQILRDLRSSGFVLDMDDFGAGYSSLNMLKDIPIDTLKIDRGFFNETMGSERGQSVIKYVVAMAHELKMKVVAEGVETKEQVEYLKQVGCNVIQGYYFSRPVPVVDFEEKFLPVGKH